MNMTIYSANLLWTAMGTNCASMTWYFAVMAVDRFGVSERDGPINFKRVGAPEPAPMPAK
jgi:hypothetical protein